MPGLDIQIQPCSGMDLLQKLILEALEAYHKEKQKICTELGTMFEGFGFPAGFSPCSVIQADFLIYIQEGNVDRAIDSITRPVGFPPYGLKVLRDGYKNLAGEEKNDIERWALQEGLDLAKGELEPYVQAEIAKLLQCPTEEVTLKALQVLQNLTRVLTKIVNKLEKVSAAVTKATVVISTTNAILKAVKVAIKASDVAMIAAAATPSGASGPIARAIGKLEQKVVKYADDIDKLDKKVCAATAILQATVIQVQSIQGLLQAAETILQNCLNDIEIPESTQQSISNLSRFSINPFYYRGYTLEIREDENSPAIAQRRYAVALDEYKIVVLQGPPSFSSSTDILIEELKYRIDNHLG